MEAVEAGLGIQEATSLGRWTANGLAIHAIRAQRQPQEAVDEYDIAVKEMMEAIGDAPFNPRQAAQAALPFQHGGMASGAVLGTADCTLIRAWKQALEAGLIATHPTDLTSLTGRGLPAVKELTEATAGV